MKFNIVIDRDEDGCWITECPSIPGCVSQGKTKNEAIKNIKEAIHLCIEVRAEQGLPLTVETKQVGTLRNLIRCANMSVSEFISIT